MKPIQTTLLDGLDILGLLEAVYEERKAIPGSKLAASRGPCWSSLKSMHLLSSKPLEGFLETVTPLLLEYAEDDEARVHMWANIEETGGSVSEHDHHDALASALVFLDYNETPTRFPETDETFYPIPGLCILFDSHAMHSVPKVEAGDRVSLALNAYAP